MRQSVWLLRTDPGADKGWDLEGVYSTKVLALVARDEVGPEYVVEEWPVTTRVGYAE